MTFLFAFFFGLCVGSFLNALEWRLMRDEMIWKGKNGAFARSKCPHCDTTLRARELIPILSFMVLRGKCSTCRRSIAWQYPLVEGFMGILFILIAWRFGISFQTVVVMIFAGILTLIFLMDLKYQLILDVVTFPAITVAFFLSLILGTTWSSLLLGSIIAGGFFGLQYVLSRGRWIGGGDIRLGVLMGMMLGWQQTVAALFLTYVIGGMIAVILLVRGTASRRTALPLGTFAAIAIMYCLLFGEITIAWYRSFIMI